MKNTFKTMQIIAITAIFVLVTASCASLKIVSVDWESLKGPSKVRQYFSVSSSEVSVYANYKDESRKEVVFFSTSHNRESIGIQTVTVNVFGKGGGKGTFQTEVMPLNSIRVERSPSKTTYTVGEKADLKGIRVMGSWKDFPDAEIPSYQITVANFNSSAEGSNRLVTVDFKGKTATFPVTVTAAAVATPTASTTTTTTPTPTTSQPTQPTQQPSSSTFNPAPNQPSPVGVWFDGINKDYLTFNADGTGSSRSVYYDINATPISMTWNASGNQLVIKQHGRTHNFIYEISGNTLKFMEDISTYLRTYTRQ